MALTLCEPTQGDQAIWRDMSDVALDRGDYFPSPITDWYRERPFKVAFAVSVVIHATLIAFIPGFRSVPIETPSVLEVQIVPEEVTPTPRIQHKPVVAPKTVEPKIEPVPEPVALQPQPEPKPEPKPEPVVRQPQSDPSPEPVLRPVQPERPPAPLTEIVRKPQIEPRPKLEPEPVVRQLQPEPAPETVLRTTRTASRSAHRYRSQAAN